MTLADLLILIPVLLAGDDASGGIPYARRPELSLQGGLAGIFDETKLGTFAAEYRHSPLWRDLVPIAGVQFTNQEDTLFYAGLQYNFHLSDRWRLSPSTAAGYYNQGDGLILGGELEFHSSIELTYRFHRGWRLGLHLSHNSNAGLFDVNPGTEILGVALSGHF